MEIDGSVVLTGGGQITLAGNPYYSDFLAGASAGSTLINVDNTISGGGYLGFNPINDNTNLTLTNATGGIIDATSGYLYVYTGGNIITNAGLMEATAGATLYVESALNNTGLIEATAGSSVTLTSGVSNLGTVAGIIEAIGGTVSISGNEIGGTDIISNGMFEVGANASANVVFAASSGTLQLDPTATFTGQILGFGAQDTISVRNVSFSGMTTLTYSPNFNNSGGVLTISDGTHTTSLSLAGQYSQGSFQLGNDHGLGTLITYPIESSVSSGNWWISPGSEIVNESNGEATFTITRSDDSPAQTVYVSTTQDHGTQNNGEYVGWYNVPVTFAAGQASESVTVHINQETTAQPDETFGLIVQQSPIVAIDPYLASATFTIHDDQAAQQSSILSIERKRFLDANEVVSGETPLTFTITRTGNLSEPVSVDWSVSGSNAADFVNPYFNDVFPAGIVTFNPGEATQTITINAQINGLQGADGPSENFSVNLSNASAGAQSIRCMRARTGKFIKSTLPCWPLFQALLTLMSQRSKQSFPT